MHFYTPRYLDSLRHFFDKRQFVQFLAWLSVLCVILDRLIAKRALYADGSCFLFRYIFDQNIVNVIPGRYLGGILMALPFSLAQSAGVHDLDSLYLLWSLSFSFPFFVSLIFLYFLNEEYRTIGFFIMCLSVIVFYIPNSFFAVGEYNLAYPVLALLVPAVRQQIAINDQTSSTIASSCLFILCLSYEVTALFSLIVASGILAIIIWHSVKNRQTSVLKSRQTIFDFVLPVIGPSFSLLIIMIFSAMAFAAMPNFAKENARSALTTYLTTTPNGAIADTWLYFIIFLTIHLVWKINRTPQPETVTSDTKLPANFAGGLLIVAVLTSLWTNHTPVHSYYSKTIFVPVFLILTGNLMLCPSDRLTACIRQFTPLLAFIFVGVTIWIVSEDLQYGRFLRRFEQDLNSLPTQTLIEADQLPVFKSRLGRKYNWSWGQVCLARYLRPWSKSAAFSPLDKEYFPQFQRIVDDIQAKR